MFPFGGNYGGGFPPNFNTPRCQSPHYGFSTFNPAVTNVVRPGGTIVNCVFTGSATVNFNLSVPSNSNNYYVGPPPQPSLTQRYQYPQIEQGRSYFRQQRTFYQPQRCQYPQIEQGRSTPFEQQLAFNQRSGYSPISEGRSTPFPQQPAFNQRSEYSPISEGLSSFCQQKEHREVNEGGCWHSRYGETGRPSFQQQINTSAVRAEETVEDSTTCEIVELTASQGESYEADPDTGTVTLPLSQPSASSSDEPAIPPSESTTSQNAPSDEPTVPPTESTFVQNAAATHSDEPNWSVIPPNASTIPPENKSPARRQLVASRRRSRRTVKSNSVPRSKSW